MSTKKRPPPPIPPIPRALQNKDQRPPKLRKKKPERPHATAALRETACVSFICGLRSLEDIQQDPAFSGVRLKTLQNWAAAGDWHARRADTLRRMQGQAEAALGAQIHQQLKAEYDALVDLRNLLLEKITGLEPRSLEGGVDVLLKLFRRTDEIRTVLAGVVQDAVKGGAPSTGMDAPDAPSVKLSSEEVLAAYRTILQRRREQVRSEHANYLRAGEDDDSTESLS